jgi:predicted  nucleic acid-binding Zn-ribbon protein
VFADGSKEMLSGCPDCGGNKFQFKPAAATDRNESARDADGPTPDAADSTGTTGTDPTPDANSRDDAPSDPTETRRDLSTDSKEWPDHGYGSPDTGTADPAPDPSGADASATDTSATDPSLSDSDAATVDSDAGTEPGDGRAEPGNGRTEPGDTGTTAPETDPTAGDSAEDPAQADARTDVVSPDEIAAATPEETEGTADQDTPGSPPTPDSPAPTSAGDTPADADDRPTDTEGRASEPRPDDRPDLDDLREELNEQFESIRIVAPGEYELNLMELYDRTEYIISLQEDGRYVIEVPDTWDTTPDPDET